MSAVFLLTVTILLRILLKRPWTFESTLLLLAPALTFTTGVTISIRAIMLACQADGQHYKKIQLLNIGTIILLLLLCVLLAIPIGGESSQWQRHLMIVFALFLFFCIWDKSMYRWLDGCANNDVKAFREDVNISHKRLNLPTLWAFGLLFLLSITHQLDFSCVDHLFSDWLNVFSKEQKLTAAVVEDTRRSLVHMETEAFVTGVVCFHLAFAAVLYWLRFKADQSGPKEPAAPPVQPAPVQPQEKG
jgi:hypothetical protein